MEDAIHGYLACMSYADALVGRVLDALEKSPYADNTIVVLWSDHGYHHGEKVDWEKHTLWERTSNVPLIWSGPGIAKGVRSDVTVSLIDLYPTLVEFFGLSLPPQELEGESLVPSLRDPRTAVDRTVYLPYMTPGEYALINRDWRFIEYLDGNELYDLRADPNEWFHLASVPEHQDRIARFKQQVPKSFADPVPTLNRRKHLVIEGESFHWKRAP